MSSVLVKLYDKTETFKETLSGKYLSTLPEFTSAIDMWQQQLSFNYNISYDDTSISHYDIVKVISKTDWTCLYRGVVVGLARVVSSSNEYIRVTAYGMQTLLKKVLYESSSSYEFTKNTDPKSIIEEILGVVNTQLWFSAFSWTASTITTYWTNVNLDFDYTDCWTAVRRVVQNTDFYFFIDWEGVAHFKAKNTWDTHNLTLKKHISSLEIWEDSKELHNDYYVEYTWWSVQTWNDATSQSSYWVLSKYISDGSIQDWTTATERINSELDQYKDPVIKTKVLVNKNYDFESIKIGDLVSILGIDYTISDKLVTKIDFRTDDAIIYLEWYDSIENSLQKVL